MDALIYSDARV